MVQQRMGPGRSGINLIRSKNLAITSLNPEDIEKKSLEIIDSELLEKGITLDEKYAHVISRCIYTSADFDYAESLSFSEGVIEKIEEALRKGCPIITDSKMVQAGIDKTKLKSIGSLTMCFTEAEDVARDAQERGLSRPYVAMEKARLLSRPAIFAVGNEPTALLSIIDMAEKNEIEPVAVIGVPVGFINLEESKTMLMSSGIPYIVNRGRKGGSHIAAAIVNAIQHKI